MTKLLAALLLVVGASACGVSSPNDPSGEMPLDPPPPPGGQQLATSTYKLAPGEEVYMCYQFYSPDEPVAITKLESISAPGVHHFVIYQALGTKEPDEPHECNVIIKQTWIPIWATGTGSKTITLPQGTGFVIQPHTQYIIQIHLQNASDSEMAIRTGVNVTYERDTAMVTPAGLYGIGTFKLEIPPNTPDYTTSIDCKPGRTMNVFTVFPHMHKIGTQLEVTRSVGGAAPASFYKIDPWTFGDQPMEPLVTTIGPDDTLRATCHYKNDTGSPVVYGESSDNEMCFFVMFYYPFSGLDGCINT
jgi:hypothetical protein